MAVLITWGMGEVGFTVEADNAKEALKVYRGITERTENVAEDRVRQIVNEQTVSVRVDHDSPWAVDGDAAITQMVKEAVAEATTVQNPSIKIDIPAGTITFPDDRLPVTTAEVVYGEASWIDWVYTDEIPIPTELTTGDLIDVIYRDGVTRYGIEHLSEIPDDMREATPSYWENDNHSHDIVKYRRAV